MSNLKHLSCLVIDNGGFVYLAERLAREFGHVYYTRPLGEEFPKAFQCYVGEGLTGVERLGWQKAARMMLGDEFDFYFCPDVNQDGFVEGLRERGNIVWGIGKAERFETDRWYMGEMLEKCDLARPDREKVAGGKALVEALKGRKDVWVKTSTWRGDWETLSWIDEFVSLPTLNDRLHNLGVLAHEFEFIIEEGIEGVEIGFDGYTVNGQFPKKCLWGIEDKDTRYIGVMTENLPAPLQEANDKLSVFLKEYGARGAYANELRGKGDEWFLIDPCFSEDTEILTNKGWRLFSELDHSETVATLNPCSGIIEYQRPSDYIARQYSGEMRLITNPKKTLECLVTPNHRVWRTDRSGNRLFSERADSLSDKGFIPRTGKWTGLEVVSFPVPGYDNHWCSGRKRHTKRSVARPSIDVSMSVWLRFLAIYLSEGSLHGRWGINISQRTHMDEVEEIVRAIGVSYKRTKEGFVLNSLPIAQYLRQFGLCHEKFVPDFVKQLSSSLIQCFLDAYCLGDGSRRGTGRLWFSTSKRMADDLQELVFKAGSVAAVSRRKCVGQTMSVGVGKSYTRRHDLWLVRERACCKRFWFETKSRRNDYIQTLDYSGMVYDVTIPNHIVYVRRNGKPFWSGNCMRYPSPPAQLMCELWENFPDIVFEGAQGRLVEPVPAAKFGCVYIIGSSADNERLEMPIRFPKEYAKFVKFRDAYYKDGLVHVLPQSLPVPQIGAIVGIGDSVEDCTAMADEIAKTVKGPEIKLNDNALEDFQETIEKVKKAGVEFA